MAESYPPEARKRLLGKVGRRRQKRKELPESRMPTTYHR
nr:MAG TPA: hypothetical protein [Caudoviricetes sp.]